MNYKMVGRIIAYILLIEILLMMPGMGISFFLHEEMALKGFRIGILIILAVACVLLLATRNAKRGFYAREGLVTTGLTWIIMSVLGCLPFYFSREIPHFVDCLFEMASGFTTTGSSILLEVESMSKGLLFWRSFSHWIGGMGVLVFLMAIVHLGGKNQGFALHILRAESPGPSVGKMTPRIRKTALILYWLYFGITVADIICLLLAGMPVFDAFCIAFGTAGTGGFGVRNDSLGSYSPLIQNITTVFMFLFSINFTIYYMVLLKRWKEIWKDTELHVFFSVLFISAFLLIWNVRPLYNTLEETIRHCFFTVGTLMSTTGYGTTDFNLWPSFSKAIMMFLMMIGACAGSTGGGMKQMRMILLIKDLRRHLHRSLHPSEVRSVQVNGKPVSKETLHSTSAYLIAYVTIIIISFVIVSLDGFSVETNLTAVIATFNNIGPGFDTVGPVSNYAAFSDLSKLVMTADMLAGRLEIFPMLVLIARSTWKKAR